ncbi:bile acid:sodium symporter family protein [Vibrio sp. T20]|uniref:bile acid:sodium symporter family protein n=1 Tax=Vibrio sp. T20 TaxID=2588450 RepID=UPI0011B59FC0|nr:bile acid:sodium symporter family protein [Vibrio sp. T20]
MVNRLLSLFPIWALAFSTVAFISPESFTSLKDYIVPLLTIIMMAMGLTLSFSDFKEVFKYKSAILVGVILQFTVMPIAALLLSKVIGLDSDLLIGMVLVGAVAGGTSSNVMAFLAGANVALSITMTAFSTLLGVILTPFIISFLLSTTIEVPTSAMVVSLFKIVLVPVITGVVVNQLFGQIVTKVQSVLPLISMVAIVLIVAIVVALNKSNIQQVGTIVAVAVVLHNTIGLALGYFITKALKFEEAICRTIAFEVGLQNSGLAAALAVKHFTPAAAIAGSIFSVWHNISGSILAGYWKRKRENKELSDSVKVN